MRCHDAVTGKGRDHWEAKMMRVCSAKRRKQQTDRAWEVCRGFPWGLLISKHVPIRTHSPQG
jgi:hypothetical protein